MAIAISAATSLIVLHFPWVITIQRAGEVAKDQGKLAAPMPRTVFPDPSQLAAPVIMAPAANSSQQASAPEANSSQQAAPTPAVQQPTEQPAAPKASKPKKKRQPAAVRKLKTKWVAPEAKPFSLGDLFNVR
jgi:hypothetical protein